MQPESVFAHFKLATKYFVAKQMDEARKELAAVERLDSSGVKASGLKALLALHDKKLDETVEFARKALEQWPAHDGAMYFVLGDAYDQQGRFSEARDALRSALRCSPDEKSAQAARRAIARINERLGSN